MGILIRLTRVLALFIACILMCLSSMPAVFVAVVWDFGKVILTGHSYFDMLVTFMFWPLSLFDAVDRWLDGWERRLKLPPYNV